MGGLAGRPDRRQGELRGHQPWHHIAPKTLRYDCIDKKAVSEYAEW